MFLLGHRAARDESGALPCTKVPVLAILKEFRRLAGIRGRSCHRPTMPHRDDVKVEVDTSTLTPVPAP